MVDNQDIPTYNHSTSIADRKHVYDKLYKMADKDQDGLLTRDEFNNFRQLIHVSFQLGTIESNATVSDEQKDLMVDEFFRGLPDYFGKFLKRRSETVFDEIIADNQMEKAEQKITFDQYNIWNYGGQ